MPGAFFSIAILGLVCDCAGQSACSSLMICERARHGHERIIMIESKLVAQPVTMAIGSSSNRAASTMTGQYW
jgi:hypothetical protein